ncbi:MAG: ferric reductase-like transmembrane domain-containing protein [Gemmatimonadota bacterium]
MTAGALAAAGAGPSPLWYATRATGAVTLVLLTATVVLGIMGTARFATPRWPRMITSGLHRNVSLLVVCFLAVHVLTALLDTFAPVGWASVLVPFASAYRPLWLGLGTLASDLVVTLVITSLLRARLSLRAWRAVHWLAYAAWPVALWHGLGTGSDARLPVMLGIDIACTAAVLAAVGWRLFLVADPARRLAAAAGVAVLPLATIVFAAAGPLQPGWAARAGTPAALLGHPAAAGGAAAAPPGPAAGASPAAPASGPFAGTISQASGGEGAATVTVTGRSSGGTRQHILITLYGTAGGGGGISLSSGRLSLTPSGSATAYTGPVTELDSSGLTAAVTGPGGYRARIRVLLNIQGSAVSGRINVRAGGTS